MPMDRKDNVSLTLSFMECKTICSKKHAGLGDFTTALRSWRIWVSLAMQDILNRYRGSVLGPFWITISTAITAFSMGYLYGILFGIDRATYLPYFTTGMIAWSFISMIIIESTKILTDAKPFMENIQVPCIVYLFRLVLRNVVILAHTLPVFVIIACIYHMQVNANILLLIPSLLILCINGLLFGTLIAFVSTRYPDFVAIVTNILQVLFFVTPVMWSPDILPAKFHVFLYLNPFYYYVNLIRNPLLGLSFGLSDLYGISILTLVGVILFIPVLRKYSRRVIFWL